MEEEVAAGADAAGATALVAVVAMVRVVVPRNAMAATKTGKRSRPLDSRHFRV